MRRDPCPTDGRRVPLVEDFPYQFWDFGILGFIIRVPVGRFGYPELFGREEEISNRAPSTLYVSSSVLP